VLAYHGVTNDATIVHGAADPRFFDMRMSEFRQQLDHLRDAGFQTITPAQYKRWVDGEDVSLPERPVLITFDDGLTSTRLATPILEEHGFTAAMYVSTGFADGDFGGPNGEPGWYLPWDQLKAMGATGAWMMQFHAGPLGHAHVRDAANATCHRYYACRFGENDEAHRSRVKADVAMGLGAMRSVFRLSADWRGSTFAVPFDDAGSESATDPWLAAYLATQIPVVFVQDDYSGPANNRRYRYEVHNADDLERFKAGLSSPRFLLRP
jgi:Polysaccharide deacetylase